MNDLLPQNFAMQAGDSKILKVTVVDESGTALPLAGTQSVNWRLARTPRSVPVTSKSMGSGVTIIATDAASGGVNCGRLDIRIDPEDSEALSGEYVHDCQIVDATGARSTIFHGRAQILPSFS